MLTQQLPGGLWNRWGDGSCHTRFTVLLTTVCYNQWRKQPWLTAQRHADRRQLHTLQLLRPQNLLRQLGMHPCVLSQAVANSHSNSVAPNRAALAQHQQCGLFGYPESISFSRCFVKSILLQSGAYFRELIFRSAPGLSVFETRTETEFRAREWFHP